MGVNRWPLSFLIMSNAAGLVLISSFSNKYLLYTQELAKKGKAAPQQILSCLFSSARCLQENTINIHAELTAGMAEQHSDEQLWGSARHLLQNPFTKEGANLHP